MRTPQKDLAMALVAAASLLIYLIAGDPSPWHWLIVLMAIAIIAMMPINTPRGKPHGVVFLKR